MGSIYDLGCLTLGRIFDYVIQLPIHNINDWREYLPLLGVCTSWRKMLINFIYQFAFIIYPYVEEARSNGNSPDTNMDLILICGKHDVASKLFIGFYNNLDFYDCISYVLEQYISKGGEWAGIHQLAIYYPYEDPGYMRTPNYTYSKSVVTKYTDLAERLVKQLWNVRYLDFSDSGQIIPHIFVSILVRAYGQKIQYLECPLIAIPKSLVYFSSELSHLKVSLSGVDIEHFPTVLSESLIELELEDLPHTFSIKYFAHHDRVMDVYFTNLTKLTMHYRPPDDKDEVARGIDYFQRSCKDIFIYKIHAPKLRRLFLRNIVSSCDVLYSLGNFSLELFLISGDFKAFKYLAILPFHCANFLTFQINYLDQDEVDMFYIVTDYLFSQPKSWVNATLKLNLSRELPPPIDVQWYGLDTLDLYSPVDIAYLLKLLNWLYNVTTVRVYNLTSISTSVMVSDITSRLGLDMFLFCPKLTVLWLYRKAAFNSVTHTQMVDAAVHLLKVIPSLDRIDVSNEFVEDIGECKQAESYAFPHLNKIKVQGSNGVMFTAK